MVGARRRLCGTAPLYKNRALPPLLLHTVSMTARALLLPFALMTALLFACAKPVNNGNACFDTDECHSGSICVETVYGKYCMRQCGPEVVICENDEACVRSEELPDGAGGAGGAGGVGGVGGAGGVDGLLADIDQAD